MLNFPEAQKRRNFCLSSEPPEFRILVQLFDPAVLKDTVVVNIDNKPDNQGYGDIVMVSNKFSSISEAVANLIFITWCKNGFGYCRKFNAWNCYRHQQFPRSKNQLFGF